MHLSVCVLAGEDLQQFESCLQSVRPIADDLLVADTSSSGAAKSAAEEAGARYFPFSWTKNFASVWNKARVEAEGDWILIVEADEELEPGAEAWIKTELPKSAAVGYTVAREDLINLDQSSKPLQSDKQRLFLNSLHTVISGRFEPTFEPPISSFGSVPRSPLVIRHYGFLPDRMRDKLQRNLEMLTLDLSENPRSIDAKIELGRTLSLLGRDEGAEVLMDCADLVLSFAYMPDPPTTKIVFLLEFLLALPELELPQGWNTRGLAAVCDKWAPRAPGPTWLRGVNAYRALEWTTAKKQAERLLEMGATGDYDRSVPFSPDLLCSEALMLAGNAALHLEQFAEAEGYFVKLIGTELEPQARERMRAIMARRLEIR